MEPFIQMLFALDLTDKNLIAQKPPDVLGKSSRCRIKGPESVFDLITLKLTADVLFHHVTHQFFKCHIVLHESGIVLVLHLQFFCNTRTDKRKLIRDPHLFSRIDCRTHQRTLHREKLRDKLRNISLDIGNKSRTRLGDASVKLMLLDIIQITPCRYVRTEGNTDDMVYAHFFQATENTLIFIGIVCLERRSQKQ